MAEPVPGWTALTAPTDQEVDKLIRQKMDALLIHYGIDPSEANQPGPRMAAAWANLAWRLAREHVPGFKPKPQQRGRPSKRKQDDVDLALNVELLRRRDRLSDRKAIHQIASYGLVSGTEQTLLQRYKRKKKQFAVLSRLFDRAADVIGHDALVHSIEDALTGDDKETFLSPR